MRSVSKTGMTDLVPDRTMPAEETSIAQAAIEVVYDWNLGSDAITWGSNFARLEGLPQQDDLRTGLHYAEHLAVDSPVTRYEAIMAPGGCDTGGGVAFRAIYGIVMSRRSNTPAVWIEDKGRWFADATDRPGRVHGTIRIITEWYERDRLLAAASRHDPETGASTRSHFMDHFTRQFDIASRQGTTFALLLIGLRRVDKGPVETSLVAAAVSRLREQMRAHEIIACHGSGKLATLLESCTPDQAKAGALRLLAMLESVDAGHPALRVSIGAVVAPCHGRTPLALLQYAEEALEVADLPTGPSYIRFEPDVARTPARSVGGSDELLSALSNGRVIVALQPIVEAKTGKVVFHEALVRVRRLDGTLILPDALVPGAEKNGLISLVDRRVIDLAFYRLTADRRIALSINASVTSLHDEGWLHHLRACCRLRPDAARRLTVEITETSAIADIEATKIVLTAMKAFGVKIAIDDFGSGHSSFRGLRQLPIDYLKIDGAFAQNLASSTDDRFFIRTLIDLARNLGIPTVAEWVEDEATAQILTGWGVDYLQGHLFGKAELAPDIVLKGRERAIG